MPVKLTKEKYAIKNTAKGTNPAKLCFNPSFFLIILTTSVIPRTATSRVPIGRIALAAAHKNPSKRYKTQECNKLLFLTDTLKYTKSAINNVYSGSVQTIEE